MKKILSILCLTTLCSQAFSQSKIIINGGTGARGVAGVKGESGIVISSDVAFIDTSFVNSRWNRTVSSVAALRAFTGSIANGTVAYVSGFRRQGDGGGGNYVWSDTTTAADDSGAIIKSTAIATGRWVHEVQNGIINLKWWGIRPHNGASGGVYDPAYDIARHIDAAVAFASRFRIQPEIYIPSDAGGISGSYYVSRTIVFTTPVTIRGDGTMERPTTLLNFPARTKCFSVLTHTAYLTMSNINMYQDFVPAGAYGDTTAHGIHARTIVNLSNVHVTFAAGNGFQLEGCLIPGDPLYGNTDFSRMDNCFANFCNTGLYIEGCDANKMVINQFNASALRRWGIYDNGMLGNTFNSPHFAFCGSNLQSNVMAEYGGQTYIAINDDNFVNINYRPDLYPQYWELDNTGMLTGEPWTNSSRWFSGGAMKVVNINAWTTIVDPYTEGFQPPIRLNTRSLAINGTPGVSIIGGSWIKILEGIMGISSDVQIFNNNGIGVGVAPNFPLHIYNEQGATGATNTAMFDSDQSATRVKIKNTGGEGLIYSVGKELWLGMDGEPTVKTDSNGVRPGYYQADLGASDSYWDNIYVNKVVAKSGGTNASTGSATLVGGTVTVNTTAALTASKIFLTVKTSGGTRGFLSYTVNNGTSFTITSSSGSETSLVDWFIIN